VNGTISITGTLPSGWTGTDIGSVGIAGGSSQSGGVYTLSGSGADIGGTADGFQFASQTLVGDGEIRARVTSQTNTNSWAKAGVMIRDGSGGGAVNALVAITPSNGFTFQSRSAVSGSTTSVAGPALNGAPNNRVRLTRSGTLVTAYAAADGATWTQIGTVNLTMASSVSVGLAVTSDNNSVLSTSTFDNVSVTPFPSPWVSADIGTTGLQGSAEYFNSVYTVKGAGALGGTADGFHYVYQTLSADGSIVARVSSLQNSGAGESVGVMMRDTLTNNAKMAALTVDNTGTWNWQTRTSTGGGVSTTTGGSGTAPNLWVQLVRSGDTITASSSPDGTNWTVIGSATVSMASNCYIGLSVASGSTSALNTSSIDNVTVVP
jgi:regulation of enolase protein 1 (concanavalin A-like superfamily)